MTEQKFTPGPWRQVVNDTRHGDTAIHIVAWDGEHKHEWPVTGIRKDFPNIEANARLIAKAPEMADMLHWLEWVWVVKEGGRCLKCFGWQDIEFHRGHEKDCELETLLADIDSGRTE